MHPFGFPLFPLSFLPSSLVPRITHSSPVFSVQVRPGRDGGSKGGGEPFVFGPLLFSLFLADFVQKEDIQPLVNGRDEVGGAVPVGREGGTEGFGEEAAVEDLLGREGREGRKGGRGEGERWVSVYRSE